MISTQSLLQEYVDANTEFYTEAQTSLNDNI